MSARLKEPNRLEVLADIDLDGAVMQVGIKHHAFGPPGPALHFNTGAIDVTICGHISDIDEMIRALEKARKKLVKWQPKRDKA